MRSFPICLVCLTAAACLSPLGGGGPTGSTSGSTGAANSTNTTGTTGATGSPSSTTSSTAPEPSTGTSTSSEDTGVPFIAWPDGGGPDECDVYAQTCPEGQKCTWNSSSGPDGGFAVCVPLARDPLPDGAPCQLDPVHFDGTDECGLGSVCTGWFSGEDGMGTCKALCRGSAAHPYCEGHAVCIGGRTDWLCEPMCDPFAQNCPEGDRCDMFGPAPLCVMDGKDEPKLAPGAACEWTGQCELGLVCWPGATPGCESYCCTPFCDRSDPQAKCPFAGQACLAPLDDYVQPGAEQVGVCRPEVP